MYWTKPDQEEEVKADVDRFGDSYARDTSADELREVGFESFNEI